MTYDHLQRWTMPRHYFGATWENWYSAGVGQSRDSDALERANFQAMLTALKKLPEHIIDLGECGPDNDGPGLQVVRESHFLVGWVEWIAIHETNTAALEVANRIMEVVADYPVIDEDLYSQIEDDQCEETWRNCLNARERLDYLKEHVRDLAAYKYPMPGYSVFRMIRAAIRDDGWGFAANLLPCPSDLIH